MRVGIVTTQVVRYWMLQAFVRGATGSGHNYARFDSVLRLIAGLEEVTERKETVDLILVESDALLDVLLTYLMRRPAFKATAIVVAQIVTDVDIDIDHILDPTTRNRVVVTHVSKGLDAIINDINQAITIACSNDS